MGANASVLVNRDKKEHVTDENVREQLEVLLKLADARLDAYQTQLEMMFVDNASAAKRTVPGKRALRFARYVGVNVGEESLIKSTPKVVTQAGVNGEPGEPAPKPANKTDESTRSALDDVVCNFFGIHGDKWDANKKAYDAKEVSNTADSKRVAAIRGFAKVVSNGLKDVLVENTSAGESTDTKFFVCIHHNAVIRIDIMTYRYNFNKKKVNDKTTTFVGDGAYENIFGYVYCVSVVDHREVTDDEIVFLASEFAGDNLSEFGEYLDQLIAVWAKLRAGNPITPAATR